jgi:hypothetical protein
MIGLRAILSGLLLLLIIAWAPLAPASTAGFDGDAAYYLPSGCSQLGGIGRYCIYSDTPGGSLTGTPTSAGLFHQEKSFSGTISVVTYASYIGNPNPGPSSYTFAPGDYQGIGFFTIKLVQTDPLRFSDITWSAKIMSAGFESKYFEMAASPYEIANGVDFTFSGYGPPTFPITIDITWTPVYDGPTLLGYNGEGLANINFTLVMTQEGHVVPVPPTLVLLGSGLLGLGGLRRFRKS